MLFLQFHCSFDFEFVLSLFGNNSISVVDCSWTISIIFRKQINRHLQRNKERVNVSCYSILMMLVFLNKPGMGDFFNDNMCINFWKIRSNYFVNTYIPMYHIVQVKLSFSLFAFWKPFIKFSVHLVSCVNTIFQVVEWMSSNFPLIPVLFHPFQLKVAIFSRLVSLVTGVLGSSSGLLGSSSSHKVGGLSSSSSSSGHPAAVAAVPIYKK